MNILEVKNLSFSYSQQKEILKNLNFSLQKGDFLTILGHNGSGKTTLALLLAGIKKQTKGKIIFNNQEVNELVDSDNKNIAAIVYEPGKIGIVFQNPENQFVAQTVKENIAIGLEIKQYSKEEIDKIIDESLEHVEAFYLKEKDVQSLSGGQKQKVAIAEQLAFDFPIIVFDEPTSLLDPLAKKEILNQIQKLHQKGKTIILITHHFEEALLGNKTLFLKDGKVLYSGEAKIGLHNLELLKETNIVPSFEIQLSQALNKY